MIFALPFSFVILSTFGIVLRKRPLNEGVFFGDLLVDQVDFHVQNRYTPRKSTCHLKIDGLKMKFHVEMVPFQGFFASFGEGIRFMQVTEVI